MIITHEYYCSAVSFEKLREQSAIKRKSLQEYRTKRCSDITILCTFEQHRHCFTHCLKTGSNIDVMMSGGKVFHTLAAVMAKARSPVVMR